MKPGAISGDNSVLLVVEGFMLSQEVRVAYGILNKQRLCTNLSKVLYNMLKRFEWLPNHSELLHPRCRGGNSTK